MSTKASPDPSAYVIKHNEYWRRPDVAALADIPDSYRHSVLADTDSGSMLSSIRYTVKDVGYVGEYHVHKWEQCFYILENSMMFQVEGDEPWRLTPGDFVIMPPGVRHRNWNEDGPGACVHLCINTPQFEPS